MLTTWRSPSGPRHIPQTAGRAKATTSGSNRGKGTGASAVIPSPLSGEELEQSDEDEIYKKTDDEAEVKDTNDYIEGGGDDCLEGEGRHR